MARSSQPTPPENSAQTPHAPPWAAAPRDGERWQPPKRNIAFLIVASVVLAAWLTFLTVMAFRSS
jgi:hypothetical protein